LKLPRDISGAELARLLTRQGYRIVWQTGSHIRLTSTIRGTEHHITIPAHSQLKVGTLSAVLGDVPEYLDLERERLLQELLGR
jgi:predicted RNA binding protein YcfA (HicA-like mRNA interferase family)